MNIIFLDFDGVLNSTRSAVSLLDKSWEGSFLERHWDHLDPIAIGLIDRLCFEAPAKVVISSTWRKLQSLESFNEQFLVRKFKSIDAIGVTDDVGTMRGHQIKRWLDNHHEVKNYVILDDDSDMLPEQKKNFVQISHNNGMLLEHYKQALNILNPTHKSLVDLSRALSNVTVDDE